MQSERRFSGEQKKKFGYFRQSSRVIEIALLYWHSRLFVIRISIYSFKSAFVPNHHRHFIGKSRALHFYCLKEKVVKRKDIRRN